MTFNVQRFNVQRGIEAHLVAPLYVELLNVKLVFSAARLCTPLNVERYSLNVAPGG